MAIALLRPAFYWECGDCSHGQFIQAEHGLLCPEDAASVSEHFETVDATGRGDEFETPYLVSRVVMGPAFVKCERCGKMHATGIEELEDGKD